MGNSLSNGGSEFHDAAQRGDVDKVRYYIYNQGVDVNVQYVSTITITAVHLQLSSIL